MKVNFDFFIPSISASRANQFWKRCRHTTRCYHQSKRVYTHNKLKDANSFNTQKICEWKTKKCPQALTNNSAYQKDERSTCHILKNFHINTTLIIDKKSLLSHKLEIWWREKKKYSKNFKNDIYKIKLLCYNIVE